MLHESTYICCIHIQLQFEKLLPAPECPELAVGNILACQYRHQRPRGRGGGGEGGGALVLEHSQVIEARYEYADCHCHLVSLEPIINKAAALARSSLRTDVRLRTLGCSA